MQKHFEKFEAVERKPEFYDLVGIQANGGRTTIVRGGSKSEGGDGHIGTDCAVGLAESLNENEDMAKLVGLSLDLVWDDRHLELVPASPRQQ